MVAWIITYTSPYYTMKSRFTKLGKIVIYIYYRLVTYLLQYIRDYLNLNLVNIKFINKLVFSFVLCTLFECKAHRIRMHYMLEDKYENIHFWWNISEYTGRDRESLHPPRPDGKLMINENKMSIYLIAMSVP